MADETQNPERGATPSGDGAPPEDARSPDDDLPAPSVSERPGKPRGTTTWVEATGQAEEVRADRDTPEPDSLGG